ncbi:tetratricopeptide repeat protein [Myxococcota bacterium]|nr:tetratricopeptide repeat protein [Myxococcota bacterium]
MTGATLRFPGPGGILIVSLWAFLAPMVGRADGLAVPGDPEFQQVLAIYQGRADPDRHREAWEGFARLAALRTGDHDVQIWCARTSFHLAHRRIQAGDKEDGARIARAGIECALRAQALRTRDYDGRYWELMNRYKAGATLPFTRILQAVKPVRGQLEELIAMDPRRPEAYVFLAMAYRELPSVISWGDDDKALEYARMGVDRAPGDPEALLELAEACRETGDRECALRYYEAVIQAKAPSGLEWETDDARNWARRQMRKVR